MRVFRWIYPVEGGEYLRDTKSGEKVYVSDFPVDTPRWLLEASKHVLLSAMFWLKQQAVMDHVKGQNSSVIQFVYKRPCPEDVAVYMLEKLNELDELILEGETLHNPDFLA